MFVIGPGFGIIKTPTQIECLRSRGWRITECHADNPEDADFDMARSLPKVRAEIEKVKPDVVVCASKGGAYALALWEAGVTVPGKCIQ